MAPDPLDGVGPHTWFLRGRTALEPHGPIESAVTAAQGAVDRLAASTPAAAARACAAGCAFCCHFPVGVSMAEAAAIAAHLRATLTPPEFAATRDRVEAACRQRHGRDARALATLRLRCPLLGADALCTVYSVRPITCRGFATTSRSACAASFADPDAPAPPIDGAAFAAALGVHAALAGRQAAAGRDGATHELCAALALAMTDSESDPVLDLPIDSMRSFAGPAPSSTIGA
jgi:Fe-S-cluster containining protein